MSVNNIVVGKKEAARSEIETSIGKEIDEIKDDHMKNIKSLDMRISTITSINNSLYYESLSTKINSCLTYKTLKETFHLVKNTKMHPSTAPKSSVKLKLISVERITPQSRTIDVLITAFYKNHFRKMF